MVVSFIPGRVRLRVPELKNESLAAAVLACVQAVPGVTRAEIKTLTGSFLIEYDPAVLPTEKLRELGNAAMAGKFPL
jgi:copper chaperone CopZ